MRASPRILASVDTINDAFTSSGSSPPLPRFHKPRSGLWRCNRVSTLCSWWSTNDPAAAKPKASARRPAVIVFCLFVFLFFKYFSAHAGESANGRVPYTRLRSHLPSIRRDAYPPFSDRFGSTGKTAKLNAAQRLESTYPRSSDPQLPRERIKTTMRANTDRERIRQTGINVRRKKWKNIEWLMAWTK